MLFKRYVNKFFHRCILKEEIESVMAHYHASTYDGNASTKKKTLSKILQAGHYWTSPFKDVYAFINWCD